MVKVRRCFWVDDRAFVLLQGKSVDPSNFINRVISLFVGLPEDPREALVKEQSEEIMIRLRISYEREIREWISKEAAQHQAQDLQRAAADHRVVELKKFGEMLMETSCFPQLIRALDEMNYDSDYWEVALAEINNKNGTHLEESELWNTALEWYTHMGKLGEAAAPQ